MAGMFVPGLATLPAPAWEAVFAAGTVWLAWRAVRVRRLAPAVEPGYPAPADLISRSGHPAPADPVSRSGPADLTSRSGSLAAADLGGRSGLVGRLGHSGHYCRYPLPHLVDSVAMLYMLWAVSDLRSKAGAASGGMGAMGGGAGAAQLPFLGLILALCICGYVVWLGDRIPAPAPRPAAGGGEALAGRPLLAPRTATCCKIAMGVAMGVMLIDVL
jgi:Domain of unknown function (DUF5134)